MAVLIITFFVIGLSFGSFLNCLVYRLANKKTILGRSYCPHCKHQLSWQENIPVFSFIFLKGRCRHCHKKISWQYPIGELIMGILFILPLREFLSPGVFLFSPFFILNVLTEWTLYFGLIFIFIFDLKYMLVSDKVVIPVIVLIFVLKLITFSLNHQEFLPQFFHLSLAILLGVLFFALQYLITRGKGIGLGDLRIGALAGVIFGQWQMLCLAIILSYLIGSLVCLGLIAVKQKKFKSYVPLGPFLVVGIFITYFFGEMIINWYF